MKRRHFLRTLGVGATSALTQNPFAPITSEKQPPNILLFTADDLHCETPGCFGGKLSDLTPNLDFFANQGIRFERAHVNVSICQPSRGILATGCYGHNNGILGFMHTRRNIPTIMENLRNAGYFTGILGKIEHSTPKAEYQWDFAHDHNELGQGRNPDLYYSYCKEFFTQCRNSKKPFYFMVNSLDPHRSFHIPGKLVEGAKKPSRVYNPADVTVPGFVPDLSEVRRELSYYLNSVRRMDETFGNTMKALKEAGFEKNTFVTFLSDNGIAIPYAKCNVYPYSTRTPWVMRWPSVIQPGTVNHQHFISGIDFFPTVLEAIDLHIPKGLDGFSFLPLLQNKEQSNRDKVFTQVDIKAGGDTVPMRCIQNKHFCYIFTPWSDGKFCYHNNNEGLTMNAMEEAAKTDPFIAKRVKMFRYRNLEELYDLSNDPNCLYNLTDNPDYKNVLKILQDQLFDWMKQTNDPLIPAFKNRYSPEKVKSVITDVYKDY